MKQGLSERGRSAFEKMPYSSFNARDCCRTTQICTITVSGTLYGWGMGTSNQLAQKDCDDDIFEPTEMTGKQLEER